MVDFNIGNFVVSLIMVAVIAVIGNPLLKEMGKFVSGCYLSFVGIFTYTVGLWINLIFIK